MTGVVLSMSRSELEPYLCRGLGAGVVFEPVRATPTLALSLSRSVSFSNSLSFLLSLPLLLSLSLSLLLSLSLSLSLSLPLSLSLLLSLSLSRSRSLSLSFSRRACGALLSHFRSPSPAEVLGGGGAVASVVYCLVG